MTIPNLKRVTITCEQDLKNWLAKPPPQALKLMLVTHSDSSHAKYVSPAQINAALGAHGWEPGLRYTLSKHLLGHVIGKLS